MKLKRAYSPGEVLNMKIPRFEFSGDWQTSIGNPAKSGVWIIWGASGNGKSSFVMQLAKYLCSFGRVIYDSLEESTGLSFQMSLKRHKMYVGVCIDTACSLGMCAERNAIANMITNGENGICRLIAVDRNGKAIPPCGACREFMVQLMPDHYHSIQIMMDYENKKMVTLGDITPNWWI